MGNTLVRCEDDGPGARNVMVRCADPGNRLLRCNTYCELVGAVIDIPPNPTPNYVWHDFPDLPIAPETGWWTKWVGQGGGYVDWYNPIPGRILPNVIFEGERGSIWTHPYVGDALCSIALPTPGTIDDPAGASFEGLAAGRVRARTRGSVRGLTLTCVACVDPVTLPVVVPSPDPGNPLEHHINEFLPVSFGIEGRSECRCSGPAPEDCWAEFCGNNVQQMVSNRYPSGFGLIVSQQILPFRVANAAGMTINILATMGISRQGNGAVWHRYRLKALSLTNHHYEQAGAGRPTDLPPGWHDYCETEDKTAYLGVQLPNVDHFNTVYLVLEIATPIFSAALAGLNVTLTQGFIA